LGPDDDFFGLDRLHNEFGATAAPPIRAGEAVVKALHYFTAGRQPHDDFTVIAFARKQHATAPREATLTHAEQGASPLAELEATSQDNPRGERPTTEKPKHLDENVQFSVYRPNTIRPQEWYTMLAFAHLSERPADAPENEPDPVEE